MANKPTKQGHKKAGSKGEPKGATRKLDAERGQYCVADISAALEFVQALPDMKSAQAALHAAETFLDQVKELPKAHGALETLLALQLGYIAPDSLALHAMEEEKGTQLFSWDPMG